MPDSPDVIAAKAAVAAARNALSAAETVLATAQGKKPERSRGTVTPRIGDERSG